MSNSVSLTGPLLKLFQSDPHRFFFEALADSLEDAVFVTSRDGRSVVTCNHTFVLMTGYARKELEEISLLEIFPGEPGQRGLGRLFDRRRGHSFELQDVALRTQQGTITLVDLTAHPAGGAGGWQLVTARPSSLRLAGESRRTAVVERLRYLTEIVALLTGGTFERFDGMLSAARRLLTASYAGMYRLSPSSPEFVAEGQLPDAFPLRLGAEAASSINRPQDWSLGQRPEHEIQRAARIAGTSELKTRPLGETNACIGTLIVGWRDPAEIPEDVESLLELLVGLAFTALQFGVQQASLAEAGKVATQLEEEIEGQFKAASEALLLVGEDLRIQRANPAALKTLGYLEEELIDLPVRDVLIGPSDVLATLLDARGHQRAAERSHITLHRRDGTPFPTHLRAMPAGGGENPSLFVTLSDESERQAIEDHQETLTQRALLGDVMAIFAHEVRNPINNITTGIQLVASRLGEDHPLVPSLDKIHKESLRLNQLMNDVLFFSRPLELKMEPTDLGDSMRRLLGRWEPRLKQSGIRLHVDFDQAVPQVAADPRTFEQVIVNLINNAVQAMEGGGTLSMALASSDSAQGRLVELRIGDTGPGIPREDLERIFDPFYTTKRDGTGLGLAISRRIIAAHQGSLTPQSFPDAGTVFTLRIPALEHSQGAPADGTEASVTVQPDAARSETLNPAEGVTHEFDRSDR